MLDLAGTDTKGKGSESAVGGGVAVAADDGSSGEGEALLGADDVDNALALVAEAEVGEAEVLDVLLESDALSAGVVLLDEGGDVLEGFAGGGGDIL